MSKPKLPAPLFVWFYKKVKYGAFIIGCLLLSSYVCLYIIAVPVPIFCRYFRVVARCEGY